MTDEQKLCDHEWRWVRDWYGDPNVINGTADCSGWLCRKCDSTDNDEPKPEPDADYLRDRSMDERSQS